MNEAEFNAMPDNERFNRVLEGLAYYASVHKPNLSGQKNYGSLPVYMVTLGLDAKNEKLAKSWGLKVLDANDAIPHPHVRIKRKIKEGVDPESVRPAVLDGSAQKSIPKSVLIGNGSKVRVKFATYWPPNGEKYGAGTTFFKMVVDDLIVYDPSTEPDSDLEAKEGGFSIDDHLGTDVASEADNEDNGETQPAKAVASGSIFDE